MRIPLMRTGNEPTLPIAWWEWLFAPIMIPLIFLLFLLLGVVCIPTELIYGLRLRRHQRQLRSRLIVAGRFMEWNEVEAKLNAGEGTLIIDHFTPAATIRFWWTEADLIAAAPIPLLVSWKSLPEGEQLEQIQEYARRCSSLYVNASTGVAKLTDCGLSLNTIYNRNLSERYPQSKIVTLLTWTDEPLVFAGDTVD